MHLEKLGLLEEKLNQLIDHFTKSEDEKRFLKRDLEEKVGQLSQLEQENGELRAERDMIRERLSRLVETIERLEVLETTGQSAGD
jgi:chromosome segregation ATPase